MSKFLFIADPVKRLKPTSDTTLALVRASLKRRHLVYWCTDQDLRYENGRLFVNAARCQPFAPDELPVLEFPEELPLRKFTAVWIRKDPPFDASYFSLCWLLALEETQIAMFNRPSLLLRYHEKMIPFEAVAEGFLKPTDVIPTLIGASHAKAYLKKLGVEAVSKPFFGFGGSDIRRIPAGETSGDFADRMLQPYLPSITQQGDRRVFYLGGRWLGDFVRLPKAGDFVSNLAQGGTAHLVPLTKKQKGVVERLGRFLKSRKIFFAGADLIGDRVSEVNITSPTGIRAFEALTGKDLSELLVRYVEREAE